MIKYILRFVHYLSHTPDTPQNSAKLLTIALSHYCDKARWALDLSPLRDSYVEEAHMPVFHMLPVFLLLKQTQTGVQKAKGGEGGGEREGDGHAQQQQQQQQQHQLNKQQPTGTPILAFADGTVVQDSAAVLEELSRRFPAELCHLYPSSGTGTAGEGGLGLADKVRALEQDYGKRLGPQTRKLVYWRMSLARKEGLSTRNPLLDAHLPRVEAWAWRMMEGGILPRMLERMDINEESVKSALEDCRQVFAETSAMLVEQEAKQQQKAHKLQEGEGGKGGKVFLFGTPKMTAADMTFATLAYPLVLPPAFASLGMVGEGASEWTIKMKDLADEFRETPAGKFALRLYEEERYLPSSPLSKDKESESEGDGKDLKVLRLKTV